MPSRRTVLATAFTSAVASALPIRAAFAQAQPGYLMVHFTGEQTDGEQIYLSHSGDGLHWTDLNGGDLILHSTLGTKGVRDPALIRSPQGDRYWILATDLHIGSGTTWWESENEGSTALVVWESTDLVSWSDPWLLDVAGGVGDAGCAWAPEAIWDPARGDYILYWTIFSTLNGIKKHRIWYARTSDFTSVSAPQLYIDRLGGQGLIDTQIIEGPVDGPWRYYRASRDNEITIEGSDSLLGAWTRLGDLSHLGLHGGNVEGPIWTKFNDRDEWALWVDQFFTDGGYMPVTTDDLSDPGSYGTVAEWDLGGTHKRHGSILNLTAAEEARVLDRWQHTSSMRLQSFNFPDRRVRHYDFDLLLEPNITPEQDGRFRMVPGLADPDGISFESVNYPGHYPRHWDFDFALEADDGSAQFAADATFYRVDGLADGSWSSFRSYNFPDRYLRHYDYRLRLDPVATASDRADATFRIIT
ncbi:glycoside hydrolase family 43 protein [Glycomyces tenuis]|uniref:glycoside hydrolase family 43 protein n=1 Tax=Glycomyces tenuis TaxID=58116 RepID=UPI000410C899|nr:glycoside hydrolase family 43 protein [Glycomyces tenuis]